MIWYVMYASSNPATTVPFQGTMQMSHIVEGSKSKLDAQVLGTAQKRIAQEVKSDVYWFSAGIIEEHGRENQHATIIGETMAEKAVRLLAIAAKLRTYKVDIKEKPQVGFERKVVQQMYDELKAELEAEVDDRWNKAGRRQRETSE